MSKGFKPVSAKRFRHEMQEYVDAAANQQGFRLSDRLPDPQKFLKVRVWDSGIIPSITLVEYAAGIEIPESIRQHEAVNNVAMATATITSLSNDVLSLQKEFVCE